MPVVASAQRPSSEVVPTSLRDLFAYRWAFRCTTADSSDVILGDGMATPATTPPSIDPAAHGVGYLLADGGTPRRIKAAYLSDDDIAVIVRAGLHLRSLPHAAGSASRSGWWVPVSRPLASFTGTGNAWATARATAVCRTPAGSWSSR